MKRFAGETVLITGGTKGLGLATAERFATEGARPIVTFRSDEESADKALDRLQLLHDDAASIQVDLSEDGAADRLFDDVAKLTSSLDVYVHNAAATAFKPLMDIKPHHVAKTFNISVTSFITGVQRASALMSPGGRVISISGMDTKKAVGRHGLLGGAKAALETLTKYFAHELGPQGIRVNGVNPGFLATDSTRLLLGEAFGAVNKRFAKSSPLHREPRLEEVAGVIAFLCSDDSTWMVGEILNVDGGQDFSLGPESFP